MKLSNFKYPISNIQFLLLLIIATAAVSCRPKGILHSWEMREVLVDLHKTEALLQLTDQKNKPDEEAKSIYYAQVLEKHGITQAEFDSSLVWYTAHPQLFDKIYPKVLAQLEAEEAQFLAEHEAELAAQPTKPEKKTPRTFTTTELDSVLWVNRHSYPSSWHELPREYYGPLTSRPTLVP